MTKVFKSIFTLALTCAVAVGIVSCGSDEPEKKATVTIGSGSGTVSHVVVLDGASPYFGGDEATETTIAINYANRGADPDIFFNVTIPAEDAGKKITFNNPESKFYGLLVDNVIGTEISLPGKDGYFILKPDRKNKKATIEFSLDCTCYNKKQEEEHYTISGKFTTDAEFGELRPIR